MRPAQFGHDMLTVARELRKRSTPAERRLWERLRNRRLGGFKFRRQYVLRGRIVDFYCCDAELIIEVDGSIHLIEEVADRDVDRDIEAMIVGYATLRFTNQQVTNEIDSVCEKILALCIERKDRRRQRRSERIRTQDDASTNTPLP